MPVDLHTHSTASDGTETPTGVVELAATAGLEALALTDHDTLEGIPEARVAAAARRVELIPGVELSLDHPTGTMHLVALWLEPRHGPLQDRLASLREGRGDRNRAILASLADLGMPVTEAELAAEAGGGSAGRPHIAAVMLRRGYVTSIEEAFQLWLARGRPGYADRPRLGPEEAITLARESGAVPILAHPHTLGMNRAEEMAALLHRLAGAGLIGLEAIYSGYHRHEREGYAHLARRFGLVPSGGSDFHGEYKPGLLVGRGFGDLEVPSSVLDELRSRLVGV